MSSADYSFVLLDRLHSSRKVGEVVAAIQEALINLIGSEDFALFVRDDNSRRFERLIATGERAGALKDFVTGEGVLGAAAAAVKIRYGDPVAVVPLMSGRRIGSVGVVEIAGLLAHKPMLTARDHQLLDVLSRHGGLALEAAICMAAAPSRVCFVAELRHHVSATASVTTSLSGGRL
jgi:hypothetical protein